MASPEDPRVIDFPLYHGNLSCSAMLQTLERNTMSNEQNTWWVSISIKYYSSSNCVQSLRRHLIKLFLGEFYGHGLKNNDMKGQLGQKGEAWGDTNNDNWKLSLIVLWLYFQVNPRNLLYLSNPWPRRPERHRWSCGRLKDGCSGIVHLNNPEYIFWKNRLPFLPKIKFAHVDGLV